MIEGSIFAEVIVDLPALKTDRPYLYAIPESLKGKVDVGYRVLVPFGARKIIGLIIGLKALVPGDREVKEILAVLDEQPSLNDELLILARWMAGYYLCNSAKVMRYMVPSRGNRKIQNKVKLSDTGYLPMASSLKKEIPVLTLEQKEALAKITTSLKASKQDNFLLYGVTGSGKTEVYLRVVACALALGRQAIMMVPEIALTPQMIDIFQARFGEQVAVLHSHLGRRERYEEWQRVFKGDCTVALGARSAVFAPVSRLGIIIIDEEHEPSYKQEDSPKYHAREVALQRAALAGAVVVLGSATPSVETYSKAKSGFYHLLVLPRRVDGRQMPAIKVIDMRKELNIGNLSLFSRALQEGINKRLEKREQVILFLNRRGFATIVICRECGYVMKCPYCDISLTFYTGGKLLCHYCNFQSVLPKYCPGCKGKYIQYFGAGTQRVEEEAQRLFASARILRMDSSTTSRKGSHAEILKAFLEGEADILVGTQMIAKGLELPKVSLVGVINADITLHMPDFRASERTFQLLTQVAGRAGRGNLEGEVLIQTYDPSNYSVKAVKRYAYNDFFNYELVIRKALAYPPYSRLIRIIVAGEEEIKVKELALRLKNYLLEAISENTLSASVDVLGPAPAPIRRVKNKFRWHLFLRIYITTVFDQLKESVFQDVLKSVLGQIFQKWPGGRKLSISVDVDPQYML